MNKSISAIWQCNWTYARCSMDPDIMIKLKWSILLNKSERNKWEFNNNLASYRVNLLSYGYRVNLLSYGYRVNLKSYGYMPCIYHILCRQSIFQVLPSIFYHIYRITETFWKLFYITPVYTILHITGKSDSSDSG